MLRCCASTGRASDAKHGRVFPGNNYDHVRVAIMDCFEVLGTLDDAPDNAPTSSSSALAAG